MINTPIYAFLHNDIHLTEHSMRKRFYLSAITSLAFAQIASAVPAQPGYMEVDGPDGPVKVRLTGDESYHQYFSEDGFPLMEKHGKFYYCDINEDGNLLETTLLVGTASPEVDFYKRNIDLNGLESRILKRSDKARMLALPSDLSRKIRRAPGEQFAGPPYEMGYGLYPLSKGSRFPGYGTQKALVILVEYNDVEFNTPEPFDYFNRMLNEEGFSDYNATGSAADYFRYNSSDAFQPQFDVYGPVKLSKNRSYYGANDPWGNDLRPHKMVIEALDALDEDVDFSQYDCDGDGYIDNVFIFYAGRGENAGGGAVTVWPHANNLSNLKDGVEADRYGCTNEWTGTRPDGVGTFIHEFGHVLGLPDLYPTGYASSFTPDSWSVMDHGSYNNESMTPPLYSAFERYALGWIRPNEIDRAVTASLQPIGNNMAGILRTPRETEFFLIENRQQTGWDEFIPGHGMLVWHIDYNDNIWFNNTVNNTPSHQYVDLMEADNVRTDETRSGDCFPGTDNVTSFTAKTSPGMTTWGGVDLDFPITGIKETSAGIVIFNVLGGASTEVPVIEVEDASDVTATGFRISWKAAEGLDHLISVYTRSEENPDEMEYIGKYRSFNAGQASSMEISGLNPQQKYYFTVTPSNGWEMGDPSKEKSVTTERMNLSYYTVEADEASDISEDGFTARWLPLEGAEGYEVALYKREESGPNVAVCDFTDGVTELPEGWSSSSTGSYGMSSYCGEAAPALRLGQNGDWIETPFLEEGITTLHFWHRGNGTDADASVAVEIRKDDTGEYSEIQLYPVETAAGGKIIELNLPSDVCQIRLVLKTQSGSLALDDVELTYGMNYEYLPCAGHEVSDAGQGLEYRFSGLPSETHFGYVITAYDSSWRSLPSQMMFAVTAAPSGIIASSMGAPSFKLAEKTVLPMNGEVVTAYDTLGRLIGEGSKAISLPEAGIYIIRLPKTGESFRVYIR